MAANITDGLTDGLSQIGNLLVLAPQSYRPDVQQTRLIAGVGYPLALRINAFTHMRACRPRTRGS